MIKKTDIDNTITQGIASYIQYINKLRLTELAENLAAIMAEESINLASVSIKQATAFEHIDGAQEEIAKLLATNRGGETGIHGFIAEFAETGIANARRALEGLKQSTVILNNNGPADFLVHGQEIQMKMYNNLFRELNSASDYQQMMMMFPKNHYEVFEQVMAGKQHIALDGRLLSSDQVLKMKQLIEEESAVRGVSWQNWMKPSVLDYDQVQKGAIDKTFADEINDINNQTTQRVSALKGQAKEETLTVNQKAQPSFGEASKAAALGALFQGGVNFGMYVYQKHQAGVELWQFRSVEWQDVGIETATGAAKGGISGYAIYGLTNICHLSAPSAGAITTGTFGLANAILQLRMGQIDDDGFVNLVLANAIDATGAAIGASIAQMIIPIPVVGAIIGSIAATTMISLGKDMLSKHEQQLLEDYQAKSQAHINTLEQNYQQYYQEIMDHYCRLGELQTYAFDLESNIQLQFIASIELAKFVGVHETQILQTEADIDSYFQM
ncbi:MAG: hypothetical protein ACRDD4_12150 [Culicoidibacterales bacterium]